MMIIKVKRGWEKNSVTLFLETKRIARDIILARMGRNCPVPFLFSSSFFL